MNKFEKIKLLLHKKCENVSIEEGYEISKKLIEYLDNLPNTTIGLAANQIGINAAVCIIRVKTTPLVLINPIIIEQSGKFLYSEGCVSFKNEKCTTNRSSTILVKCDNYESLLYFDVSDLIERLPQETNNSLDVLEIVAIQHEIDHLNGITMFDREIKKYNRNDKIIITKNNEEKFIKFKNLSQYENEGWIVK